MPLNITFIILGVILLAYAGDKLVDFASALGKKAKISPAVIGLTIVATGTSFPELIVSFTAALRGSSDIAIANAVGSNISNIALVLGFCACISAVSVGPKILKLDYPFLVLTSWIALLLSRDGLLDRLESSFFLLSLLLFTAYSINLAQKEIEVPDSEKILQRIPGKALALHQRPFWQISIGLLAGFIGLVVGAKVLIEGATSIAQTLGMSDRVIGLTIIAIGTSLPELVTSAIATYKKQYEMAITNIVGSNILNLLLILGITGIYQPIKIVDKIPSFDMWVMMFFTLLLFPMIFWDRKLSRIEGLFFLCLFAIYTLYLIYFP